MTNHIPLTQAYYKHVTRPSSSCEGQLRQTTCVWAMHCDDCIQLIPSEEILVYVKSMDQMETRVHQGIHLLRGYSTPSPQSPPPGKLYDCYTCHILIGYLHTTCRHWQHGKFGQSLRSHCSTIVIGVYTSSITDFIVMIRLRYRMCHKHKLMCHRVKWWKWVSSQMMLLP